MSKKELVKTLYKQNITTSVIKTMTGLGGGHLYSLINELIAAGELKPRRKFIQNTNIGKIAKTRVVFKEIEYQPLGKPVTIMELTNNTCRWPCAGSMFCGAEVSNRGYCLEHYNISIDRKGNDDDEI